MTLDEKYDSIEYLRVKYKFSIYQLCAVLILNQSATLIKEPTKALKVSHKFNEEKPHPMIAFFGLGGDINQEIADIVAYMGTLLPDLSIMIRAKSKEYLETFINNPQKQLTGTYMPRVG